MRRATRYVCDAMKIDERFIVNAPIARVWAFINDPEQIGPCVPGCGAIELIGARRYRASVRLAVGPIKTVFTVEVEVTEETPPERLASVTRGEEGGRASSLTANSLLALTPLDGDATEVHYESEVSVVGRLGKFGLGVMRKKVKSLGEAFAAALKERVEAA